jgi:hypothetical protein
MSAPTNTETTLTAKGIREDLSNLIFRVAADKTPFISNIGRTKATNTFHEWQTETLADPDGENAALEGGDVGTLGAPNRTTRVGNRCQILTKDGGVSGTAEEVDKAGRASELARQKLLKGKEAMRDLEKAAIGNRASQAESGSDPRKMGGAVAWITSNVSRGSGGSNGGYSGGTVSAATNGTQRTFTEDQLKDVMALAFAAGASPSQVYLTAANKQDFSAFAGIADIRLDAAKGQKATIMGAADFYQSDFGILAAIPHPYGLSRDALFADPDYLKLATLRPWKTTPLAKTGDSEKFQLVGEFTLEVGNQAAHAVVADLSQ